MRSVLHSRTTKTVLSLATAGVLATGLAACGSSSSSGGGSGTSTPPSSAPASPVAMIPNLTGVSTTVKLDPSFLKALASLKVKPGVVSPTMLSSAGVVNFPITGGSATYYKPGTHTPYVESNITHTGGISLTAGGKKVELTNFVVDAGTSKLMADVSVNGTSAAKGAYVFFLDGRNLQPLDTTSSPGNAVLTGTEVKISPTAASLLNMTFGTTAIMPYTPVGVATITLKVPAS